MSHPTASRALADLVDVGLVHVERGPVADAFQLDPDHILTATIRTLFEHEQTLRADLIDLLRQRIGGLPVSEAYLFGSVARGEETTRSDIDVAVVCKTNVEDDVTDQLDELSERCRRRYGNTLSPVIEATRRRPTSNLWTRIRREGIDLLVGREEIGA